MCPSRLSLFRASRSGSGEPGPGERREGRLLRVPGSRRRRSPSVLPPSSHPRSPPQPYLVPSAEEAAELGEWWGAPWQGAAGICILAFRWSHPCSPGPWEYLVSCCDWGSESLALGSFRDLHAPWGEGLQRPKHCPWPTAPVPRVLLGTLLKPQTAKCFQKGSSLLEGTSADRHL